MFFGWNHGADKAQSKKLPTLPLKKRPTCRNRDAIRGYYLSICKQSSILSYWRMLVVPALRFWFRSLFSLRMSYAIQKFPTRCLQVYLHPGVPTIHDILDELLCSSGMVEPQSQLVQHHCMFNVYLYTHINPHIHTYHTMPYHTITLHCITWLDITLHMYLFVCVYIYI